jgi:nicotinamidase-related amidase
MSETSTTATPTTPTITTAPLTVSARPYEFTFNPATTALVVIDMQRDFLEPEGFGESLGNDVSQLRGTIEPLQAVLVGVRAAGMTVIHTREGHLPDLSDLPPAKLHRGNATLKIGDPGPKGRILIRGEYGQDIIDELAPIEGEVVIDKPGKGAFYATAFGDVLAAKGITSLVVTGVTTEVCVHTTVREANDRGFECLVLSDCVGSYFPEFQRVALDMVAAQGGIFGWVAPSADFLAALTPAVAVTADGPAEVPSVTSFVETPSPAVAAS